MLDNFSSITNSNLAASDFNDKKFMVTTVPTSTTITITMPSNESGSGATTSGGIRVQHYYPVGPAEQAKGFGWSLGSWVVNNQEKFTTTTLMVLMHSNHRNYIRQTHHSFQHQVQTLLK